MLFKKKDPKTQNVEGIQASGPLTIYQASDSAQIRVETHVKRTAAKVQVVDVSIVEDDDYPNPILDIKLRNSGDEVAFVKSIEFQTVQHWDIFTDNHPSLKSVSAAYEVSISETAPSRAHYKISHEIKPQETDRIQIRLSTEYFGDPVGLSIFLLDAEITYNEDNLKGKLPSLLLNIQPSVVVQGSYFPGYSKGTITRNKAVAKTVLGLSLGEMIVQDGILEALESWLQAPAEGG